MAEQQQNKQQDRPDEELVLITKQVKIGLSNYRITLEKSQPNVIYKLCLAILQQYSFFNAFIANNDVPKIYMQPFCHTVTYNVEDQTYFFTLDNQVFEVNADLLYGALQITPKDPDHPFVQPPPENEIISFIKNLGYPGPLTQIDAVLGNLKFTNKGEKDLIYGMAIPLKMMSDEIKASADYLNYLAKSMGTQPDKEEAYREIIIEETGQLEEVADTVDSEEIEDEEDRLIRRQTGVVIGRQVHKDSDEENLDHSKKLKGIKTLPAAAQFMIDMKKSRKRMWHSIGKGPYERPMIPDTDNTTLQIIEPLSKMTEIKKKQYMADVKVMNYPLQAIPNDIYNSVDACKNAKQMWE
ncbi:hypothetical protein Tco_0456215 [Tanacetum coccineum]